MTEEQAERAEYALQLREFTDKQEEHPWNIIQMEREIGGYTLKVWGRGWSRALHAGLWHELDVTVVAGFGGA